MKFLYQSWEIRGGIPMQGIHLKESKHREGETVQEHHHQTYQILYVLEDEGKITLDGREYYLNPDHVAFIAPYSNHSIIANSKLTVLVLEFGITQLDEDIQTEIIDKYLRKSDLITLNLF